jgi:transcriptional regulator with XRE-family HTH domain
MPAHSLDRVVDRIIRYAGSFGSRAQAAKALGISPQYLSDIITRRRRPGPSVLRAIGIRRVDRYEDA